MTVLSQRVGMVGMALGVAGIMQQLLHGVVLLKFSIRAVNAPTG